MPWAAILGLLEQYGPTAIGLISTLAQNGPKVWSAVAPVVQFSLKNGTLAQDVSGVITAAETLLPMLTSVTGPINSLGDVAGALQSIGPTDAGNPQVGQRDAPIGSHAR